MRTVLTSIGLISAPFVLTLLSGCATKDQQTVAEVVDDNRIICREDRRLGSNLPRKTCKTVAEWEAIRKVYQEDLAKLPPSGVDLQEPSGTAP